MQALAYPAQELQMEKSNSTSVEGFCPERSLAIGIPGQGRKGLSPQQPTWKVFRQDCIACRFLLEWATVCWKKVCCSLSPRSLQISQSQVANLCYQGNAGSISIRVFGGTAPYSYAWTGPNGFTATSENLQNLASGSYQVRVTDANGCTITGAAQMITEPSPLALNQVKVDNSCFLGGTGNITVTASGGTAPYSYAWTGPNNFSFHGSQPTEPGIR